MFFDYCGSKIYYEDLPSKAANTAETIVFLHGWGSDMRVFFSVAQVLQEKYRCVLIDFLGFGQSDLPLRGMTVEMQASSVLALCNFLEIKKFHLLSHSYGGRVSISLLSSDNSRVVSALLAAPAGVKDSSLKKIVKLRIFKIRKSLTPKKQAHKLERFYSQDFKNSFGVMRETFQHAISFNQKSFLFKIKQPVLIVWGKEDGAITKQMIKSMQKRIKNCNVCKLSGDHFAFLQNRLEFELAAKKFFCVY